MNELKAPEKTAQKMTRDGAVSVNLATGEASRISGREAEADFSASNDRLGLVGDVVQRLDDRRVRKNEKKKRKNGGIPSGRARRRQAAHPPVCSFRRKNGPPRSCKNPF